MKNKHKMSSFAAWVSIILNIILFILKYWAGIISSSVALIADAWHTLSDSISSFVLLIGMNASNKPADSKHPFGHGRIELIVTLFIGFLLLMVAYNFIVDAFVSFQSKNNAQFGTLAIVVTIISIIVKLAMAQFSIKIGNKIKSDAVKADGWHHLSDALSSVVILIGIYFANYYYWIDAVLAMIIALFILYTAYEVLKGSINSLIGVEPDKEFLDKITSIVNTICNNDLKLHHFHFHNYINHTEITFHIMLDGKMSIMNGNDISNKIRLLLLDELNIHATIHIDPIDGSQF